MPQEEFVSSEVQNKLATITFFHPASNSLPAHILQQLGDAILEAGTNPKVQIILLKSEGAKAFCAGASFDELVAIQNEIEGQNFFSGFAHVINAIRICGKLVIGRIQGKAVGGGVGLASAVDYAFATEAASVKLSELAVGIGPFVVGPAVERKIGVSAFSQLAIEATEWRPASWAAQKGLYNAVFDSIEEMDKGIEQLISKLRTSSPEAMSELKKIFWNGTENWEELLKERAAISGKLVLSDFTRNAISTFKAK